MPYRIVIWVGVACLLAGTAVRGAEPTVVSAQGPANAGGVLRVEGRHFVDRAGGVVLLRGVNLAGNSKVPPFLPLRDHRDLDAIAALGMNVIRLVVIWEAAEPEAGRYDVAYLGTMRSVAEAAWARGIFTIVDFHQDGFSRHCSRGAGDGFPRWALSKDASPDVPDNGPKCKNWPVRMMTDPSMHRSFRDFYADVDGVRTRYLLYLRVLAATFGDIPGVIGYDLINEPWGDEAEELSPLYRDGTAAVRAADPDAIVFLEGHASTNTGMQTGLLRPEFGNAVYAPHYYKLTPMLLHAWLGSTATINLAFRNMSRTSIDWNAPLFLGEFGIPPEARGAGDYIDALYDRLDVELASCAQWNFTPLWNERDKDGWNAEDFTILEPSGRLRPNYRERPYPQRIAGPPGEFRFVRGEPSKTDHEISLTWNHDPARGATILHVPNRLFPPDALPAIEGRRVRWSRDPSRQVLTIEAPEAGPIAVRLQAPAANVEAR